MMIVLLFVAVEGMLYLIVRGAAVLDMRRSKNEQRRRQAPQEKQKK